MQNVKSSQSYNDQKVTIYYRNGFGIISKIKAKLKEVRFGKWAQYEEALEVVYKLPRKQKYTGFRQTHRKFAVIVDGWDHPDFSDGFHRSVSGDVVVTSSKYASFDPRYMSDFNEESKDYFDNVDVLLDIRDAV